MELGVGSHPAPAIYAYYFRPCYAELLDIGTSYPTRATTVATASPSITHLQAHRRYLCHVMTGDGSSSWNSPSSLHTPTASISLMMTTSGIQSSLALIQDIAIVCT
ncbi:UNVERIFIED_CONTAM: hypothetical protein Slati_1935700 [Sesamum latifolium]|uniref:Uncharacterized protein n=1 Tax=Sesamum latifolium TaxID=2727402 RepID=A0AAW2X2K1_9LAMI